MIVRGFRKLFATFISNQTCSMISYIILSFIVLLYGLYIARVTASEDFIWIGAVTDTSFTVHVDVAKHISSVVLSTTSDFTNIVAQFEADDVESVVGDSVIYGRLRKFGFTNLNPSTLYYVGLWDSTTNFVYSITSVRTFPTLNQSTDIVFAFASCLYFRAWSDSFTDIKRVYEEHASQHPNVPFFMIHTGDLVYSDITANDTSLYEESIRSVVTHSQINPVFRAMPVVYMYDDHDYGADNSDFSSPSRGAALSNYRTMIPNYPLASSNASYFAFTVGRIRIIVTDLLSNAGKHPSSILGLEQRQWFLNQLSNATLYDLVIWVSTKPWIGRSGPGRGGWYEYPEERILISNHLAENNVDNLVFISGDAHMLAADNGSHSDYSTEGGAGFPVFQSGPLGNVGTSKGGPYSEGCSAYRLFPNKQYSLMRTTVENSGDPDVRNDVCVEFAAHKAGKKEPLISWRKCGKISGIEGQPGNDTICPISWLPPWMWFVLALILLWIIIMCINCVICLRIFRARRRKRNNPDDDQQKSTDEETEI